MKTALISVYNKQGIVEFAKELTGLGYEMLASGGTAKVLSEAGLNVKDVASLVGGGAILGHRVVTLSREVHAGLLARDNSEDRKELESLNIPFIDLVCVDLYPLAEEIRESEKSENRKSEIERRDAVIEKTDIGGPTMMRSAAKGRRIVICDPLDRKRTIDWLKSGEPEKEKFISELVAKAEYIVADYTLASARYHSNGKIDGFIGREFVESKYGENAWQTPAGLLIGDNLPLSLYQFKLIAGTAPSYNNMADVDRLLQTITHIAAGFEMNFGKVPKIAVGVKHGNPCGAAVNENPHQAIENMLSGDLRAIFGGVVMVNFTVDEAAAEILLSYEMPEGQRRLLDGIIAPEFSAGAVEMLKRRGDKCRFLVNPALANLSKESLDQHKRFRYVRGGFLTQPNYTFILNLKAPEIFTLGELLENQKTDVVLAWAIGSTSNSNTVSLVKNQMLIGNGVGQQDRVGCCELAIKRATSANHETKDAAAYSDSFFPFIDGPETLQKAGIKTIFATSGSVRDEDVKKFCSDNNINLIMLPDAQARGFFGH
jgi:phosphoribosylaminoimidazolecarboxamide formyltransferase/IMP cyclohydrolase